MSRTGETNAGRVKVWDLPTRLFHWLFAGSFAVAWLTHEHDRYLDVHVFFGYLFFGLLLFRLVWGLAGGRYARFPAFRYSWRAARDYLLATWRGIAPRHVGHNPAGAWAIFLLLVLGLAISVSGLLVLGGEERHGPLAGWVSFSVAAVFREAHEITAFAMLVLVAVHIVGVAFESWRHRENLAAAMITGYKRGRGISTRTYSRVGAVMVVAVLAAAGIQFAGYARATPGKPYLPFTGPSLPANAAWDSECGSCHLAFHPTLLPARSWQALLDGQASHFGDDLALDPATVAELREFARRNAAESALTEAAWKINRSIPPQETPLRITETGYWKRKHRDIEDKLWQAPAVRTQANCAACHLDAERGTFEDAAMRLPASADQAKSNVR
ncbi:cytochrome B [Sulfuricaulis limicola]|uniref:Cytochrome B n=1 Tax=Sulfuricaulis limicola TaxID=1620215 RepID=A0A1B4XH13_9GAMM|nr:cytochrome b/b6 domain-containing protein [Sulfuricaulis limicola]BAV34059.1 cytochrome B [Sulfuricaulis limicola]